MDIEYYFIQLRVINQDECFIILSRIWYFIMDGLGCMEDHRAIGFVGYDSGKLKSTIANCHDIYCFLQALLAYPFLKSYPESYLTKAFEFGRVFDYTWTVNWRMVDQETFLSDWFSKLLLLGHAITLLLFIIHVWCKP